MGWMAPGFLGMGAILLHTANEGVPVMRKQLQAAEEASDNPAIVELSRRIVDADPNDSETWETLATKQLELDDLDRCAATLDAWQAHVHPRPKKIDDLRGDLAMARKDDQSAEQLLAFVHCRGSRRRRTSWRNSRSSANTAEHWQEAVDWRTRALVQNKTAAGLIARANDYVELRAWDKAFADVNKANAIDPSDDDGQRCAARI